jgi:hypothetical protein
MLKPHPVAEQIFACHYSTPHGRAVNGGHMKSVGWCWSGLIASLLFCVPSLSAQPAEVAPGVLRLGTIENAAIGESSGIVPSRRARNVFWTHNDSGADTLYAISAEGAALGEFKVKDTELQNWEDIASSGGRLYIADIGNNGGSRNRVSVHAVPEPNAKLAGGEVRPVKRWQLEYPNDPFDAESFFVHRGYGYVIEKESGNAHVYRFRLSSRGEAELQEQCELNLDAPATGADITADGKRLAVITGQGAYLFTLPGRVPSEGTLEPTLFVPFTFDRMEACAFTQDGLIVTAETREIFLFTDPQFRLRSGGKRK